MGGVTGGGVVIWVVVKHVGQRSACAVDSTLHLVLQDRSGQTLRGVHGNPATRKIRWKLDPGKDVRVAWQWSNWCGKRNPATVTARFAGVSTKGRSPSPYCLSPNHGSGLIRADGVG